MTVFISWSGDESKHVALALKHWLPRIIQNLETFVSTDDIPPGVRWFSNIADKLEESNYGVICVTPSNQTSEWLNFEAGAIGKQTESSRVTPFAIGMSRDQISGPLAGFNAVNSDEEGFRSLVRSINSSLPSHAPEDAVLEAAEAFWPKVEEQIQNRPRGQESAPTFDPNQALQEIRALVRQIARDQQEERQPRSITASRSRSIDGTDDSYESLVLDPRRIAHRLRYGTMTVDGPMHRPSDVYLAEDLVRRAATGDHAAMTAVTKLTDEDNFFMRTLRPFPWEVED